MVGIPFDDYRRLGAVALVAAYRSGELSPVDATESALQAIDTINPQLNAVTHIDPDEAFEQARASEARWLRNDPNGPLDGVPTLIKDGLLMRGVPVYRGTVALKNHAPTPHTDAPCVARLREDGAVLLGKTSMCDLGMLGSGYSSMFGPTRNPWNLSRTSGGSTSGSSAALAAGLIPVAVGTDIVGSIRLPASFCGLAGLKPSYGRVPFHPNSSPAAVAGPMARTVEDMALLMSTISRPDARDFAALAYQPVAYEGTLDRDFTGTRIGFLKSIGFGPEPDPQVVDCVADSLRHLEAAGCVVEEIESPFGSDDASLAEDFYRLRPFSELEALPDADRRSAQVINTWAEPARAFTGLDYHRQFLGTQALRASALAMSMSFDFLALPTSPIPAFAADLPTPVGQPIFAPWANTFLFNLTEQPAMSVNCGFTADGLPIGLQLVAQRFDDIGAMQLACAFERARGAITFPGAFLGGDAESDKEIR